MRTLLCCLIATTVCGKYTYGEERRWTISYTTQAELVAVKGNTVFLKASEGVQTVPLDRLSESDRQFVASLAMAPIQDKEVTEVIAAETLPNPEVESGFFEPAGFTAPQNGPALAAPTQTQGGERSMLVTPPGRVVQQQDYESTLPAPAIVPQATSRANVQALNNGNGRRLTPSQQNQINAANQKRARDDSRPGLFGARARRLANERQ
ncbi:MAG TPA: hypothetical protein VGM76_03710 [Lacipirellulaceae bacterium]|jgi:hypothetical protein